MWMYLGIVALVLMLATYTHAIPNTRTASVSDITADSAMVSFTTLSDGNSILQYGLTSKYGRTVTVAELTKNHSVTIESLEPGTTFHYRVKSMDQYGYTSMSPDMTFTTLAKNPAPATDSAAAAGTVVRSAGQSPYAERSV
jgi:phosphodiesterase/alkaline phosphatase D-like protein